MPSNPVSRSVRRHAPIAHSYRTAEVILSITSRPSATLWAIRLCRAIAERTSASFATSLLSWRKMLVHAGFFNGGPSNAQPSCTRISTFTHRYSRKTPGKGDLQSEPPSSFEVDVSVPLRRSVSGDSDRLCRDPVSLRFCSPKNQRNEQY